MPDPERSQAALRELIDATLAPPPLGPVGPVKRRLRDALVRIGRPGARHQQQVDRMLLEELHRVANRVDARLQEGLGRVRDEMAEFRAGLQETQDRLAAVADEETRRSAALAQQLARTSERVPSDDPLHGDGSLPLEEFDAGLGGTVLGYRDRGVVGDESRLYLGFEEYFRGSEEVIRERQRSYIPVIGARSPVLDVGCGRGEFLELMQDAGLEAAGIDVDPAMVEHCHRKGLDHVVEADAASYLEACEDGSLGAIFAAQVIEHLPYAELLRVLRASRRKLKDGGVLVLETVNPHSPQGLKHFWIDPTHRHPLFPEAVVALCWLVGFAGAFTWYPQGSGDPDRDRIRQLDYAVVAETARGD